jgi:hypothetical protein
MGGIFGSPDFSVDDTAEKEAEAKAEKEKQEAINRKRRGLDGTINTSYQGVLNKNDNSQNGKKLLGE